MLLCLSSESSVLGLWTNSSSPSYSSKAEKYELSFSAPFLPEHRFFHLPELDIFQS